VPRFGHVPMILGLDGKKLSKRHGATAVADYQHEGILPQAMANFLALIGWSPGDDRELFFDMDALVDAFSFDGIQRRAAVFDPRKLQWMNGEHLRHLGAAALAAMLDAPLAGVTAERREPLIKAVLPRSWTTLDVVRQVRVRAGVQPATPDENAAAFIAKNEAAYKDGLRLALAALSGFLDWTAPALETELRRVAEAHGMKVGALMQPIRIVLTGGTVSEPVNELLVAVGREAALARLAAAAAA
jgi:glutamyl-tRNA synthetase